MLTCAIDFTPAPRLLSPADAETHPPLAEEAARACERFFRDPETALRVYTLSAARERPPLMEVVRADYVMRVLERSGRLPPWALGECEDWVSYINSTAYGQAFVARVPGVAGRVRVLNSASEAAEGEDAYRLRFVCYNAIEDGHTSFAEHKILATRVTPAGVERAGGDYRLVHLTQDWILALAEIDGVALMVTSFHIYALHFKGSWGDSLRLQSPGCRLNFQGHIPSAINSLRIQFAAVDRAASPPSLVCVCGVLEGSYLVRIIGVDSLLKPPTLEVAHASFLGFEITTAHLDYLDYLERTSRLRGVPAVLPGFAVDGRGRIWLQTGSKLRVYHPDFELADERDVSPDFEIIGVDGEIQLVSMVHRTLAAPAFADAVIVLADGDSDVDSDGDG